MPKSFLVKKNDELPLNSSDIVATNSMEALKAPCTDIGCGGKVPCPDTTSGGELSVLKVPRERDSLHKFAISKMLGIDEDMKRPEADETPVRTKVPKLLDENCNNVDSDIKISQKANDLKIRTPPPNVARELFDKNTELLDKRCRSLSPDENAAENPMIFNHSMWKMPFVTGIPHPLPSYFPFGLGFQGLSTGFVPFSPLSGESRYSLKPYQDPFFAAMRHIIPHPRLVPGTQIPFPSPVYKQFPLETRDHPEYKEKLVSSAFDPVVSKYTIGRDSSILDINLPVNEKRKDKDGESPRYHCDGCTKVYATFSGLSKHKQFHCSSQVKKEFSCKYCEKTYVSLGALKMHIRTHTLPCKCKLCGKAFSRPWLLQGHIRTHTGEKPFRCDHCARAFADRSNLRAHLQTHSDIKKYSCKSCCKTFSRMSLLLKHEDGCCSKPILV